MVFQDKRLIGDRRGTNAQQRKEKGKKEKKN